MVIFQAQLWNQLLECWYWWTFCEDVRCMIWWGYMCSLDYTIIQLFPHKVFVSVISSIVLDWIMTHAYNKLVITTEIDTNILHVPKSDVILLINMPSHIPSTMVLSSSSTLEWDTTPCLLPSRVIKFPHRKEPPVGLWTRKIRVGKYLQWLTNSNFK